MIDEIITELEACGWQMDAPSGLVNFKAGMGCHMRVQDSVQNATWRVVERRWREKARAK